MFARSTLSRTVRASASVVGVAAVVAGLGRRRVAHTDRSRGRLLKVRRRERLVAAAAATSNRPERAVAGVAESGEDEPVVVEAVVDGDRE